MRLRSQHRRQSLVFLGIATAPATALQLRRLAVISAIPCFVFGFLDNAVMLVAGDAIEGALGLKLGLTSLACVIPPRRYGTLRLRVWFSPSQVCRAR